MESKSIMPSSVVPVYRALAVVAALVFIRLFDPALGAQTGASRFALAMVADRGGKALVDIGADDFVVQESGASREVLDVRVADYPVAIVVDNGRRASADFLSIRSAVARFIDRLGPRPLALVTTAPEPAIAAKLDDERPAVVAALEAIEAPGGTDGQPLRAAALAAQPLPPTGSLVSAIVLVTATPFEVSGTASESSLAPIIDSGAVGHVVAREPNEAGASALTPYFATGADRAFRGIAQQMHGDFT